MIVDSDDLFIYLLAGLTAFADGGFRYPYPETLVHARGLFAGSAIQSGRKAPKSISTFLLMVQHPIREWWPMDELPTDMDPDLPLLYSDGQLPNFAMDWLLDMDQRKRLAYVSDVAAVSANRYIAEICDRLPGNLPLQSDYVVFRRFLIEHPWLDASVGLNIPANVRQLMVDELRYYERVVSPNMIHDGHCWQCPRCKGLLHWVDGQPHCASGLCDRLTDLERADVVLGQDILSLRMVFRRRVQLPGLPELNLFKILSGISGVQVELWPDGDKYDLRIDVSGLIWRVDVKDYSNPNELAVHLRSRSRFSVGGPITYVVPSYRDDLTTGYSHQLRQLVPGIQILTDEELIADVSKRVEVGK